MKNTFITIAVFTVLILATVLPLTSCPSTPANQGDSQTQVQHDPATPLWTGDGGKGISLAVLEPAGRGITQNEQWMLSLI